MAMAQQKGDNLILIATHKAAADNYKEFGKYMVASGYTFSVSNDSFYTFTTASKDSKRGYVSFILSVSCLDSCIYVRPKWGRLSGLDNPNSEIQFMEWEYLPAKSSWPTKAWETFEPVLSAYGALTYKKE